MFPQQFETERLILQQSSLGDAAFYFACGIEPKINRYMTWPAPSDISETRQVLEEMNSDWTNGTGYNYTLLRKSDEQKVGAIEVCPSKYKAMVGYMITPDNWNKGYRMQTINAGGMSDASETVPVIALPASSNLLRNAKASASSEFSTEYVATMANDGNLDTRWNSAQGQITNQWLVFELPTPKPMDAVLIYQTTQWTRITKYRIEIMQDGTWRDVFRGAPWPMRLRVDSIG